jgi:aromatic ring-opening dioxygenase LigB subunit
MIYFKYEFILYYGKGVLHMAGLVIGGVAPHGSSVIGEIAGEEFELFKPTRDGMEKLGERVKAQNPDTIVILTPHGLRIKGHNAIYTCEYCRGTLEGENNSVSAEFKCDKPLAEEILKRAVGEGIPCVGTNFGALSGPASNIEMDWGTLIPLWFMGARDEVKPEIVVIGPTREILLEQLVDLGRIIAEAAKDSGKRVALIASADQAHAHDPNGFYGYDPAAPEYDQAIISIIKENKLEKLLDMDLDFVERAKPDSLWQMLILYGASTVNPMKGEFLSYQVPTYFGMIVASYEVLKNEEQ